MKSRKISCVGMSLIIIGIAIFIFYYTTGEVFFYNFDEVTQIEGAKIKTCDSYVAQGIYEAKLLILSILSFFLGVIILCIHNRKLKK